jgi:hypothetical protein
VKRARQSGGDTSTGAKVLYPSCAFLIIQEKHLLLIDSRRVIEYAWEAASEKIREPAKTVKNHLMVPHPRIIKIMEDLQHLESVGLRMITNMAVENNCRQLQ